MTQAMRPPRVRAALLGLVLGATALLSACNPGRPPAATVEGMDIPDHHVDALLDAYRTADPELYDPQLQGQGEGTTLLGASTQVLDRYVIEAAIAHLAEERGVIIGAEDRAQAETELRESLVEVPEVVEGAVDQAEQEQAAAETEALREAVVAAIPADTLEWLIERGAARIALSRELAADAGDQLELARAAYEADQASYTQYCIRAIQALESDVEEAQSRLDAGEDFGAVSEDLTVPGIVIDEQGQELAAAQGEIGCIPAAQVAQASPLLQQSIASLPGGGVTEPEAVTGADGAPTDPPEVFILEVSPPQVIPFEEVAEQIISTLPDPGSSALNELLRAELGDLDISVNPRFGRWDPISGTVVGPSGATPPAALPLADE